MLKRRMNKQIKLEIYRERRNYKVKVRGTVLMNFEVELDVDDISTDSMSMYESDALIAKAIDEKMPHGFYVESDIHVTESQK